MTTEIKGGRFARNRRAKAPAWLSVGSLVLTVAILGFLLLHLGSGSVRGAQAVAGDIGGRFNRFVNNAASEALDGVYAIRRVYRLEDRDIISPVPKADNYGTAKTIQELDWLEEKGADLLEGQKLYFGPDRVLHPGSEVKYYLDDSILTVTWKETVGMTVYTFAEVKIAHGSQLRRFLAGGEFGSDKRFTTTEMAQGVNAVIASSGDFYKFRYNGVVVYENQVRRVNTNKADTCYIDENGDLHFTYQNASFTQEEAQRFVDDNKIRFSLTFGPVLVDNYERCEPKNYELGEVNDKSSRAAICQMDKLHYLLVTANVEDGYPGRVDIHQFAERIVQTGCEKGYTLDGGQTAALALDGELVNHVLFGQQRPISDIVYFATAIPDGGDNHG